MTSNTQDGREERFLEDEGYDKTIDMLSSCATAEGFVASTTDRDNYRRIWGRDGAIIALAALLSGKSELIDCCRRTLRTLANCQGPHGEIPSNVSPGMRRISYGGTTGRVDSGLWFVIACTEYWKSTGDDDFLEQVIEPLEKVRFLLGAWEFNTRGLLYVPPTGDWADEYVHSGYVLYDQILYLQALRSFCEIHHRLQGTSDHGLQDRVRRLKHLICANYWFTDDGTTPDDVYHEILYEKGRRAAPRRRGSYWMPFFSPLGYGYRFDAMANVLVSLFDVGDCEHSDAVDRYIADQIVQPEVMLLPAFHPVITPKDEDWEELQMTFSYTFKNAPHESHNGGLWPLVTGFYCASLARRGKIELAEGYLEGIHRANQAEVDGQAWVFPEYLHGKHHTPGGTLRMGWSAAAAVIGHEYLKGKRLFESLSPAT